MKASPSIATAAACRPGTPFAMITNMAVCPELRRRGISHMLMQVSNKLAAFICVIYRYVMAGKIVLGFVAASGAITAPRCVCLLMHGMHLHLTKSIENVLYECRMICTFNTT
jgi:hypothetical protein